MRLDYTCDVPTCIGGYDRSYCERRMAQHLTNRGQQVCEGDPIPEGNTVTLAIVKGGQRISVEMQTGKSYAIHNIRKDLDPGGAHVISVALTADIRRTRRNSHGTAA